MFSIDERLNTDSILTLLSQSLDYYLLSWKQIDQEHGLFGSTNPESFNMSDIGSSSPVIEYVIRPHVQILCILSAFLHLPYHRQVSLLSKDTRDTIESYFRCGTRWVCETHLTGDVKISSFLERKQWGENWRSSLWATMLAMAYFFGKEYVDITTEKKIKRIIQFEANRFIDTFPPSGYQYDTKVEENAQDSCILAWALALLPDDSRYSGWEKALTLWTLNIATTFTDKSDHSRLFNKSVAHWIRTETLFPDGTGENHGFFHPEIFSYTSWIAIAMSAFKLTEKPIPTFFNRKIHQHTFELLLRFCLPSGMLYPPGSSDLPMCLPRPFSLGWGLFRGDPRAYHITARLLSTLYNKSIKKRHAPSPIWVPGFPNCKEGWELLFQSQVGFEIALLAMLPLNRESRLLTTGHLAGSVDTRHIYPYVELCFRRNVRSSRSVSWKAIGDHPAIGFVPHNDDDLTIPCKASLLNIPQTTPHITWWEVAFHEDQLTRDGFDSYGRILYYDKSDNLLLNRDIRVLTWGDDGLIIGDTIRAARPLLFCEQFLSGLSIQNNPWDTKVIYLTSGSLKEMIGAQQTETRPIQCPSHWISINDNLLIQHIKTRKNGLIYLPANGLNAPGYWKNGRVDMIATHCLEKKVSLNECCFESIFYVGTGKKPRPFKYTGTPGEFFKGFVIMDGKYTSGL